MSKAFLSYVHEDIQIAEELLRHLQRNGIGVWRDKEELSGGQRWKSAIREAIKDGTYFLALHSKNREEKQSSYAHTELSIAIDELQKMPQSRRWLIPARIDDCSIDDRNIGGGESYLDLHVQDLRDFEKGVLSLLKSLGVKEPKLASKKSNKNKRGEFVAPQGSPFNAINALREFMLLDEDTSLSTEALSVAFGENTVRDLSTLGLLQSPARGFWRLAEKIDEPKLALAVAVSKIPAFQVAVSEMQKCFEVSSVSVGKTIAEHLGREWSSASCQRNGAAYKRWVVNLYPNFRLPKEGEPSFLAARAATQRKSGKGRPTYITSDILLKISEMKSRNLNVVQMAEILGMTPQAIYNWRRKHPEKWEKL